MREGGEREDGRVVVAGGSEIAEEVEIVGWEGWVERGKWWRIEFLGGIGVEPGGGREEFLGRFFEGTVEKSKMLESGGVVAVMGG